jgi:hypothetical protein
MHSPTAQVEGSCRMNQRQKIFSVLGPLVGVILAYFIYTSMADFL